MFKLGRHKTFMKTFVVKSGNPHSPTDLSPRKKCLILYFNLSFSIKLLPWWWSWMFRNSDWMRIDWMNWSFIILKKGNQPSFILVYRYFWIIYNPLNKFNSKSNLRIFIDFLLLSSYFTTSFPFHSFFLLLLQDISSVFLCSLQYVLNYLLKEMK